MSITSSSLRLAFRRSDTARDAGLTTPADIRRFDDIVYGADAEWEVLDVYRPRSADMEPLPVIVSVHGGGWVYGSKEVYQFYCMDLAQRGFAVVNFSYHLAPERKFPTQLEETSRVFHWVLSHAAEYGFDADAVFAVGDSAGANLLGLFCAMCADPVYAAAYAFSPPPGFVPRAVAFNCGLYRVDEDASPLSLSRLLLGDYMPNRGSREELDRIDLISHVSGGFPPVFLMTANADFLREQAPPMAERLAAVGAAYESRCYGDAENKLQHVFHCDIRNPSARLCSDEECAFFRRFL